VPWPAFLAASCLHFAADVGAAASVGLHAAWLGLAAAGREGVAWAAFALYYVGVHARPAVRWWWWLPWPWVRGRTLAVGPRVRGLVVGHAVVRAEKSCTHAHTRGTECGARGTSVPCA